MADEPRDKPQQKDHDVVLVHGRTEDGQGLQAIRSRPDRLEVAELRPVKDGKPLGRGEVISLHPRRESPILWDVKVQYSPEEQQAPGSRSGPPRVSTSRYRANWETIFGRPARRPRGPKPATPPGDDDPKALN